MTNRQDVVAVVLAGGEARRMGGGDKGLRLLADRPLLCHILRRVGSQVRAIALSANGDAARFAAFGLPILPDATPGAGPLAGVLAGMHWAAGQHQASRLLLSVPTDTPLLPDDLVERLLAVQAASGDIVCAGSRGRRHPVVALWPVALAEALAVALAAGERRVERFATLHGLAVAEFAAAAVDPFMNINNVADLAAAAAALGGEV